MTESPTPSDILARIDKFCTTHSMSLSGFGRGATGDGSLVLDWKAGNRSPTLKTVAKVEKFMAEYAPQQAAA
jgi:hypothetical protein